MKKILTTIISVLLGAIFTFSTVTAADQVLFPNRGGTGTSTIPTLGKVLVGQSNGTYAPQATSTLGVQTPWTSDINGAGFNLTNTGNIATSPLTEKVVNGTLLTNSSGWTLSGDWSFNLGNHEFELSTGNTGNVYQDISVTAGYYVLSFVLRYSASNGSGEVDLIGASGGGSTYVQATTPGNSTQPQTYTGVVYLPSTETIRYRITGFNGGPGLSIKSFSLISLGTNTIYTDNLLVGSTIGNTADFYTLYQNGAAVITTGNIGGQTVAAAGYAGSTQAGISPFTVLYDESGNATVNINSNTAYTSYINMGQVGSESLQRIEADNADNYLSLFSNNIKFAWGNAAGGLVVPSLSGGGNQYVCVDTNGVLYASGSPCI